MLFSKQKTAYEMRISDWSSDVCSSDLRTWLAIVACASATTDPTSRPRTLACTTTRRSPFSRLIWLGPSTTLISATLDSGTSAPRHRPLHLLEPADVRALRPRQADPHREATRASRDLARHPPPTSRTNR